MLKTAYKILAAIITIAAITPTNADALTTGYYTTNSALSTGKWVKIKVTETGMQQITDSELRSMGFNDPSKVAVYGYSSPSLASMQFSENKPDDLPQLPALYTNGKLIFYAQADASLSAIFSASYWGARVTRNHYSAYSCFFLTDSKPPLRPTKTNYNTNPAYTTIKSAVSYKFIDFKEQHFDRIGAFLFGKSFTTQPIQEFDLHLPAYQPSETEILLSPAVGMSATTPVIYWKLGNSTEFTQSIPRQGELPSLVSYRYSSRDFFPKPDKTDNDHYTLVADASRADKIINGGIDRITLIYPRTTDISAAGQQELILSRLRTGQPVEFTGVTPGTTVWNITDPDKPTIYFCHNNTDEKTLRIIGERNYTISANGGAAYIMTFNPDDDLCHVESLGEIQPQNIHATQVPDMLIISSKLCLPYAKKLSQLHAQYTGLHAEVVLQDLIYNEFSSGTPHIHGLRRFIKMLYDREPGKLKAVLLFGGAFSDNRGLTYNTPQNNFRDIYIPIFEDEQPLHSGYHPESYSTDAVYGMLNDNFSLVKHKETGNILSADIDINVGRIPAIDKNEAQNYIDKVERYLANPPKKPVFNKALISADYGNINSHMLQGDSIIKSLDTIAPSVMCTRAYNGYYPIRNSSATDTRNVITNMLMQGVAYWSYAGHGLPTSIGNYVMWANAYTEETDNEYTPLAFFATCNSLQIDQNNKSIMIQLLFKNNGGTIASIGAGREVYKDYNHLLNIAVAQNLFMADAKTTIGDVYRRGHNQTIRKPDDPKLSTVEHVTDSMVNINTLCYNLIGDPMLPVYAPSHKIKITTIGQTEIQTKTTLQPLTPYTIAGQVTDLEGTTDTSFNGEATISIYDGEHLVSNYPLDGDQIKPLPFDENLLYEIRIPVVNGQFSGNITLPIPTYPDKPNRVSLFAVNDNASNRATGHLDGLTITDLPQNYTPAGTTSAPQITTMYIDSTDFAEGDLMPSEITLFAEVAPDEYGLIGQTAKLGQSVKVNLDGTRNLTSAPASFTIGTDGAGHLELPVKDLSDGHHTLTLTVYNTLGESSSRSVSFTVVNTPASAQINIEQRPARTYAEITLTHDFPEEPTGRIVITDPAGNTVYTKTDTTFPFRYNLTTTDGQQLPDGTYTVSAYLTASNRYATAKPATLVIIR